jgi:hypothetical protein
MYDYVYEQHMVLNPFEERMSYSLKILFFDEYGTIKKIPFTLFDELHNKHSKRKIKEFSAKTVKCACVTVKEDNNLKQIINIDFHKYKFNKFGRFSQKELNQYNHLAINTLYRSDDSEEVRAFRKFQDTISWIPTEDELYRLKQIIFKRKEVRHYKEYRRKIYFFALVSNADSFLENIKLPLGISFKAQPIKDVVNLLSKLKMDYKSNAKLLISYDYNAANRDETMAYTIAGEFDLIYPKPKWRKYLFKNLDFEQQHHSNIENKITAIISILRLFGDGYIEVPMHFFYTILEDNTIELGCSSEIFERYVYPQQYIPDFSEEKMNEVIFNWPSEQHYAFIRAALSCYDESFTNDIEKSFLKLISTLEILFKPNKFGNIKKSIVACASKILDDESIGDFVSLCYKVRSENLHEGKHIDANEKDILKLRRIVRRCIIKVIQFNQEKRKLMQHLLN